MTNTNNSRPFGSNSFNLFVNDICNALISRRSFDADWMKSQSGINKMSQIFNEGMSMDNSITELELWCKGWVSQNKAEIFNPSKLALSVSTLNLK